MSKIAKNIEDLEEKAVFITLVKYILQLRENKGLLKSEIISDLKVQMSDVTDDIQKSYAMKYLTFYI